MELSRIFAANGHRVALVARREELLHDLAAEFTQSGAKPPIVIVCDLQRKDACDVIAAALASENVDVEFVVNNAGFGLFGEARELDLSLQLAMVDLNVRLLTALSLCFSDSLIRHRGGILNVASIAAFLSGPRMAVYYASKAYVLSLTEALRGELGSKGVRVTALCPGPVPTGFQSRAGLTPGLDSLILNVSAKDVAKAGYRGLMANRRLVLPGIGIKMIPFFLRFAPRGMVLAAVERVQRER